MLENVKRFYTGHDMMEPLSIALALATSSAILLRAALTCIGYLYTLGIATIALTLLCFLLVFIGAFCILNILKLSARLSIAKKALIVVEVVICIAIMHVVSI